MHHSRAALFGIVCLGLSIAGCQPKPAAEPANLDGVLKREMAQLLQQFPQSATYYDADEEQAGGPYNARLPDFSPAGEKQRRALLTGFVDELNAIPDSALDAQQRASRDIVKSIFETATLAKDAPYGTIYPLSYVGHTPYVVNQISGPAIDIPNIMQAQQRVKSEADAEDYVARLKAFGPMFDGIIAKLDADAQGGFILPKALMRKTIDVLDNFVAPEAADNLLYVSLSAKLARIDSLAPERRTQLLSDAQAAIQDVVYPAYRKLAARLKALEDKAPETAGMWAQPGGPEIYRAAIRNLGDSDFSADEIHQIGLAEVDRISDEMDRILRDQGYENGTVGERMMKLASDPRFTYAPNDQGRAQVLSELNGFITDIEKKLPDYFATLPPQKVEIRRVPQFSEASSPTGYYDAPSLDGSRPGIYWINLRNMEIWPSWSLKTLTYHEAVPGHHFQNALALTLEDMPLARRVAPFNAYTEGWALYSERLAWEMGMYKDDPYGNLGRLRDELFRAVRLVVDTGMHAKHWTREQAIDYMQKVTGNHIDEVTSEIERYMAWPGQALGYKMGMLNILALREKAKEALGDAFDIRDFHTQILMAGPMPMSVLSDRVETWIATQQHK